MTSLGESFFEQQQGMKVCRKLRYLHNKVISKSCIRHAGKVKP